MDALVIAAGVVVIAAVNWWFFLAKRESVTTPVAEPSGEVGDAHHT
ncbi:MAG: hypothetical protein V4503_02775 [Gemmatimonadota bacterium]